ncbi:MAG: hypothetical protein KDD69_05540 [Bdellovibrionales bacterium]|nr:hypothetical protein [Bdellovibrionales bacterium]
MYKSLVISPHLEERLRLQHLLEHLPQVTRTSSAHDLEEALLLLNTGESHQVIFISTAFGPDASGSFIERARRSNGAQQSTFILLATSGGLAAEEVGSSMLLGFHGFLCGPYSMESVSDAIGLAGRVQLQTSQLRLKAATGLMLADTIAEGWGAESPADDAWQRVQRTWETYKRVTGESLTAAVVDGLHKIAPGKRLPSYTGVSQRVRKLFAERTKQKMDK